MLLFTSLDTSVGSIKLYSSVSKVSVFWLANRGSKPNMGSPLYYCAYFLFNPSSLPPPPPKARGIELSRNHSPSPVSGILIAVCWALQYILNYRYNSGNFATADIFTMRSFVTFPRNCTYCRLSAQHRVLQHHVLLLPECCCRCGLPLVQ